MDGGSDPRTRPAESMVAVMPSLVERRIHRRFSAARMRTRLRCWRRAALGPNQPSPRASRRCFARYSLPVSVRRLIPVSRTIDDAMKARSQTDVRQIRALKVQQWLAEWDKVHFD